MSNKSDLNTKMNELYKSMSKGQKLLTNYITDNYDKAHFLRQQNWVRPSASVNLPWCDLPCS